MQCYKMSFFSQEILGEECLPPGSHEENNALARRLLKWWIICSFFIFRKCQIVFNQFAKAFKCHDFLCQTGGMFSEIILDLPLFDIWHGVSCSPIIYRLFCILSVNFQSNLNKSLAHFPIALLIQITKITLTQFLNRF